MIYQACLCGDCFYCNLYKEICSGIDRANIEIEKHGAWVGYPEYIEIYKGAK